MRITIITVTLIAMMLMAVLPAEAKSEIRFDFERDSLRGWDIPGWALEQGDHVAGSVEISKKESSSGKQSMAIMCDFPGDVWTAALVEYNHDMDLEGYKTISVDCYVPRKARSDLFLARIIMTAGPWQIFEMQTPAPLVRGKWITITARLDQNEGWKSVPRGENLLKYINKVRKLAVRIEYNANPWQAGPKYEGPIYIDNIVIK